MTTVTTYSPRVRTVGDHPSSTVISITEVTVDGQGPRWAIKVLDPENKPTEVVVIASSKGVLLISPAGDACIVPPPSVGKFREALREAAQFNEREDRRQGGSPC